jgi:hypothetical protein
MTWVVQTSDEFDAWWKGLDERTQNALAVLIRLLQEDGPYVPRPYADKLDVPGIDLRELRRTVYDERNQEHVYRILYAFDPLRHAFLCLGGDKANDKRWYQRNIPRAKKIFANHLEELKRREKERGNG